MHPRERLDYSLIDRQSPLRLLGNARFVVWSVLALEELNLERPMARTVISPPQGQPKVPDPSDMLFECGMAQFERLYAENAERPKFMVIACHPFSPACHMGSARSSACLRRSSAGPA